MMQELTRTAASLVQEADLLIYCRVISLNNDERKGGSLRVIRAGLLPPIHSIDG